MNICMLSTRQNAAETRLMMQAASLRAAGYRVAVVEPLAAGLPVLDVVQGTQVFRIHARAFRTPSRVRRASTWRLFTTRAAQVATSLNTDVVQASGLDALWPAWRIAARCRARLILDLEHGFENELGANPRHGRFRRFLKRFRLVLVADPHLADRMEWLAPELPVATVKTRFPALDPPPSMVWPRRYRLGPDHGLLFVPLGAHAAPGVRSLLAAMERLPARIQAVFATYGGGSQPETELIQAIRSGCADSGRLRGRVHAIRFANREAMIAEAAGARLGCVVESPSSPVEMTSSTAPLLHCLAARLPVVVPDREEYRPLVDRYGCGVAVDVADRWALARAIGRQVDDVDRYVRLHRNARRAAGNECWEPEARTLVAAYHRHVGLPSSCAVGATRRQRRM